jgi:hypothetical protein
MTTTLHDDEALAEEEEPHMKQVLHTIDLSNIDDEENHSISVVIDKDNNNNNSNEEEETIVIQKDTPIPWKPLTIVLFIFIADALSGTTLGPYITDLIMYMGLVPDGDKKKIGRYAGMISTSYYVAQAFSAYFWGLLSDKYGRRPILLMGILGSTFASLSFGFSTTLYWALFSRFSYGLLNGNLGVYKTYLVCI